MGRSLSPLQTLLLGVAVCVAVAVAALGVYAVGSRQWLWNKSFHLRAEFREVHGVEPGTRVRLLGKEVGEVESVDLPPQPSGEVTLVLRVDERFRSLVRSDARAQIIAEGMVGGKVVEIRPGSDGARVVGDRERIATLPSTELTDVLDLANHTLQGLRSGEGTIGKLVKDEQAYKELLDLMRQGRGTMAAIQRDADVLQKLPVLRSYVHDPQRELVRPDYEPSSRWFREADLFEPGRAVLTGQGKEALDSLVPWLAEHRERGSEVVVASYADPSMQPELALAVTQKQSETVCNYLTGQHSVHKLGVFARRKVTPVGCGIGAFPGADGGSLPVPRVEIVVFLPQS
jgi:phospholipid/cholesterol/gamma-HCH transport system substrate-binding protein